MSSVNVVMVTGRLGGDPEMKYTPTGTAITRVNVAVDNGYWNKDKGEWVDSVTWLTATFFGPLAELISTKAEKGDLVYVGAKVITEDFVAKDGTHVVRPAFKGNDFKVLFKKNPGNKQDSNIENDVQDEDTEDDPPWDDE